MADSVGGSGATIARRLVDSIVTRDFDAMRPILATDVWMRALLPRELVEVRSAEAAVGTFEGWLAPHEVLEVRSRDQHTVEGREFFSYTLLLRPEWAPDVWHVVEQSGYCRVANDRVTRIDLVCTGYFPTDGDTA